MSGPPTHRFYIDHPKSCARDDYWGQVKRTVGGKPVSNHQITIIVDAMAALLALDATDRLLDLCCGNGALTTHWFQRCSGGLGVDFSPTLVDVAQSDFARPPQENFRLEDVLTFSERPAAEEFNKAILYGSMQYLTPAQLERLLSGVRRNHPSIERFVVGNVPDKHTEPAFRGHRPPAPLDDPDSAIGVWWSVDDLAAAAARAGWAFEVHRMPDRFYARHYRFDALLVPA